MLGAGALARRLVFRPRAAVFVHPPCLRLDLDDPVDRPVEEIAVVRDEHHSGGQPVQELLEPLEPGEVQVVRRLVEQEHVEAGEQDRGERCASGLAARQGAHLAIRAAAQPDVVQHGGRAGVEVFPTEREEAVEGGGVRADELVLVGQPRREPVHLLLGAADSRAPREVVADRLAGPGLELLRQVPDGAGTDHPAGVGRLQAGEHAQQRRLPDPVRADDADAVARGDDQRHVVEHLNGGIALRDVPCCQ